AVLLAEHMDEDLAVLRDREVVRHDVAEGEQLRERELQGHATAAARRFFQYAFMRFETAARAAADIGLRVQAFEALRVCARIFWTNGSRIRSDWRARASADHGLRTGRPLRLVPLGVAKSGKAARSSRSSASIAFKW